MDYSKEDVKSAAKGRWKSILVATGIPAERLDGKHHPCPKCEGTDRFRAFDDVDDTGGVICNQCHSEKNGDGFATLMWFNGWTFPQSLEFVAKETGCSSSNGQPTDNRDIVERVANDKRMPVDAFRKFGAESAEYGRKKVKVARVPVWNEEGAQACHFDIEPGKKGRFQKGGKHGLFLPGRVPEPGEAWLLVEGVKDAAALVGLGYLACGLPTCKLNKKFAQLFKDVDVIVVPDLDEAGKAGAEHTGGVLYGIAASVRIARLPGEFRAFGGDDIRDVLRGKHGEEAIRDCIEEATGWKPTVRGEHQGDPPKIEVESLNESRTLEKTLHALGNYRSDGQPVIYQRGSELVQVVCDPVELQGLDVPAGTPRVVGYPKALARALLLDVAEFWQWKTDQNGVEVMATVKPPTWLVNGTFDRNAFPASMPSLVGIVQAPTLRSDGTILQTPGYDAKSGVLYQPGKNSFPAIPDTPTQADAKAAAKKILDLVVDFPFASDAHKSVWLSYVLTLVCRSAVSGPAPLFAVDATVRGSGKSLLSDIASLIAYGQAAARKPWPAEDDETRKTITAIALAGLPAVTFDNLPTGSKVGGTSFDAALTSQVWQDRILGRSEMCELPMRCVFVCNGNNITFRGDTGRRALYCRIESREENPEDRTGFKYPDLLGHVRQNRGEYVRACLTLMRAWFENERPQVVDDSWGSFEAWNRTIRQAIIWAGAADPLETKREIRDADDSAQLVTAWHKAFAELDPDGDGLTTSDLLNHYQNGKSDLLTAAVEEGCYRGVTARTIGNAIKKHKGRVIAGRRLEYRRLHRANVWLLVGGNAQSTEQVDRPKRECNHLDTDAHSPANVIRDGITYCRTCDKYLGRVRAMAQ